MFNPHSPENRKRKSRPRFDTRAAIRDAKRAGHLDNHLAEKAELESAAATIGDTPKHVADAMDLTGAFTGYVTYY